MDRDREEENRRVTKRGDDVEVNAPFGWKVRFPARYLTSVIISVAGFGALGYMLRDHDLRVMETLTAYRTERNQNVHSLEQHQISLDESMQQMIYVLTLPEKDRARLNLQMPETLRRRLLDQERGPGAGGMGGAAGAP
jgi:hypothetical protein